MKKKRLMVEASDATAPLSAYAREVGDEPLFVTENGKPLAMFVSLAGADWETVSLSTNPKFIWIIEESRRRLEREGGIPSMAEVRRRLGLKPKPRGVSKP